MLVLIAVVLALVMNLFLTPIIIRIAFHNHWFDRQDERKIHNGDIPRLGGLGIFYSFVVALLVMALSGMGIFERGRTALSYWPIIVGAFAIHLVGLVDDFKNLPARLKFFIQSAAALLVIASGFHFRVMFVPWGNGELHFGLFSYLLTYVWIVGVTNAMNLIDGMDGLAGTITSIATTTFGIFFLVKGNLPAAIICFTLLGSVIGFLASNFPPAKIFMGDSGSLSVGFLLSVLPLLGQYDQSIEIGFLSAVVTLVIPIYDTATAMLRRVLAGVHLFTPDKRHIHHKLMMFGFGQWTILAIIGCLNVLLGLSALASLAWPGTVLNFWIKVGMMSVVFVLFVVLHYLTKSKT